MGVATKKGSNSDEVLQVVDLMIGHARAWPDETLGVIAMVINHANRIEEVLRQRLGEERDPALEDFFNEANEERAFVKNLERVQGDERDAIILSIGYGKNADGKMLYNFGPLNREGGERRLNVAITRGPQAHDTGVVVRLRRHGSRENKVHWGEDAAGILEIRPIRAAPSWTEPMSRPH